MNAKNELIGFVLILVALWIIWFFTGGPERSKNEGLYTAPATNVGNIPGATN
jgi:thiol:disulfide interchange protein